MFKVKRNWEIFWLIILLVGLYLNRAYAYFFNYLGAHEIVPPPTSAAVPNFYLPLNSISNNHNFKYAALGDSLTRGVGITQNQEAYPFLIAQKLARKNQIEYTDLAKPGSTTADLLKNQIPLLGDGQYQYLSVMIGINDVLTAVSAAQFEQNYQQILQRLSLHTPHLIVINIPFLASSHIILPPYNFLVDWRTQQFNSMIKNLIRQKTDSQIIYVDLYNPSKQIFTQNPQLFSQDYFHPNAQGYKLWSEIINADLNY